MRPGIIINTVIRAGIIGMLGLFIVSTAGAGASVVTDTIDWFTIDGGGGSMSGNGFELNGTIGQFDATSASALTGGGFELTGGFWAVTLPACSSFVGPDFNHDCHVDASDLAMFKACSTRAGVPYNPASLPSGCVFAPDNTGHIAPDFDHDGDVDQDDFAILQRCYSGAVNLAASNCDH